MFDNTRDVDHVLMSPVLEHVGHGVLHLELVGGGLVLIAPQLDRNSILAHGGGGGTCQHIGLFPCSTVALILFTIIRSAQCQSVSAVSVWSGVV